MVHNTNFIHYIHKQIYTIFIIMWGLQQWLVTDNLKYLYAVVARITHKHKAMLVYSYAMRLAEFTSTTSNRVDKLTRSAKH